MDFESQSFYLNSIMGVALSKKSRGPLKREKNFKTQRIIVT